MKIIRVIENINHGGFGVIDKVKCDDGHIYARKTFSPAEQFKADKTLYNRLKARFIREVKTQKVLPGEYFMPILYDNLDVANPYFIMPLADDVYTSEIEECKSENRNPEGLADVLNALEFLHDKGLVHRDLKPQNILKHNGVWKLADFGLVSQDKEILSQTITTSNGAFGTAHYCAPEQAIEFNRITPQADIYSFGAILHDIFSDGHRVPYSELNAPGEIGQIIAKCTKHKKEQRFKSIKNIRTKLLTFLANEKTSKKQSDIEWLDKFADLNKWDEDMFENFVFYTKNNPAFQQIIFKQITEEALALMESMNKDLFNEFSLSYLEWAYNSSFQFDYCDVVANIIFYIFQHTKDIEVKAKCAVSAAEVGRSHNRWYVMKYVIRMSSPEIDNNLAFRIGMEIELEERNRMNFSRCVEQVNQTTRSYHEKIRASLRGSL